MVDADSVYTNYWLPIWIERMWFIEGIGICGMSALGGLGPTVVRRREVLWQPFAPEVSGCDPRIQS